MMHANKDRRTRCQGQLDREDTSQLIYEPYPSGNSPREFDRVQKLVLLGYAQAGVMQRASDILRFCQRGTSYIAA